MDQEEASVLSGALPLTELSTLVASVAEQAYDGLKDVLSGSERQNVSQDR